MSAKYSHLAVELEGCLPPEGEGRKAIGGGLLPAIVALASALRSGDITAIKAAFLALLTILLSPSQPAAANAAINWQNIWAILSKVLLLLGG